MGKKILICLSLLFSVVALLAAPLPPLSESESLPGAQPPRSLPGRIVVRFKPGASQAAIQRLNARHGARVLKRHKLSGLQRIAIPSGVAVDHVLAAYRSNPLVAEANVSHIVQVLDYPNDTNYPYQWHLRSTDGGIWADTAWDLAPLRGQGVVVAVIDTGVAYEDYNGSMGQYQQSFKQAPDLASTPFVHPWDFNNNDAHPNDDHGHGTHVTGTITQDTNNAYGVAGVAYDTTIMPLKVADYTGNGNDDDLVEALYFAVQNGAKVINISLGIPGSGSPDANGVVCAEVVGLNAALDHAYSNGVVVVAAAGNDGGGTVLCPAAYPSVVAVGATRFDAQVTAYSNRGAALDITAPGGDLTIDQSGDGYGDGVLQEAFCYDSLTLLLFNLYDSFCDFFNSGTSMASPHVAGAAALLQGQNPSLAPDQVRQYLESTARDGGAPGRDDDYGWGVLDAADALAALLNVPKPPPTQPPGLDAPSNLTSTAVSANRIDLAWTDNATNEAGFKLERSTDGVTFSQVAILAANTISYANTSLNASTTYHYRIRVYNGPEHSAYSNVASATTQPPPAAPTNLTAVAVSSSRISLTWTDNANNEAGFKIERSTDGVNFSQVGTALANATSYANTSLGAGITYHYRVRAYEGSNHSGYSNVASATTQPPPAAPTNLTAVAVSSGRINLTWTDNANNEAGFKIERSTDGINFSQVGTAVANVTSYANTTNLGAGITYHYRVRAYEGPNHSGYSNVAWATTN